MFAPKTAQQANSGLQGFHPYEVCFLRNGNATLATQL